MTRFRPGDVRPGKCFVTGGDARLQVRRVQSVAGATVTFEGRDMKGRKRAWVGPTELPMDQFLAEAAKEVGSDYAG